MTEVLALEALLDIVQQTMKVCLARLDSYAAGPMPPDLVLETVYYQLHGSALVVAARPMHARRVQKLPRQQQEDALGTRTHTDTTRLRWEIDPDDGVVCDTDRRTSVEKLARSDWWAKDHRSA